MNIFMTGASGFIGTPTVTRLIRAGHRVEALVRSDAAAEKVRQLGASVLFGALTDAELLRSAAHRADGVIHQAFVYDFANLANSVEIDLIAIRAMLSGLTGSGKTFVGTNGTLGIKMEPGAAATEETPLADPAAARGRAEDMVRSAQGIRGSVISLAPTVHGAGDHSFIPELITVAKRNGTSFYPGAGENAWQAVSREDAAELYHLVLENGQQGRRYHGVAEEAISMRELATAIGDALQLPTESLPLPQLADRMGWIGHIATLGGPVTSTRTQIELGWQPNGPTLLDDLKRVYIGNTTRPPSRGH